MKIHPGSSTKIATFTFLIHRLRHRKFGSKTQGSFQVFNLLHTTTCLPKPSCCLSAFPHRPCSLQCSYTSQPNLLTCNSLGRTTLLHTVIESEKVSHVAYINSYLGDDPFLEQYLLLDPVICGIDKRINVHYQLVWTGNTENGLPTSDEQLLVIIKKTRCRMKIESWCLGLWETLHYQRRENPLLMLLSFPAPRDHHLNAWQASFEGHTCRIDNPTGLHYLGRRTGQ